VYIVDYSILSSTKKEEIDKIPHNILMMFSFFSYFIQVFMKQTIMYFTMIKV